SFFQKANDLSCRSLACRLTRLIRAQARNLCGYGLLLSDEPRVVRAWARGWDAEHFIRLLRWRDSGFASKVVYDIGAHDGRWSEMCQFLLRPERCYLFEPQTTYQEMAQARQPREGAIWKFIPVALGD